MKGSKFSTIHDFDYKAAKLLLKKLKLRQTVVAKTLGIPKMSLNHILNGYRYPNAELFLKLAEIIGVPPIELQYMEFERKEQRRVE